MKPPEKILEQEGKMGKKSEHIQKLLELTKEIGVLGEAVEEMDKNMESTWTDEVERLDLQRLKGRMQKVEEILCKFKDEIGHLEDLHCKST
jgi:hypothetical protein